MSEIELSPMAAAIRQHNHDRPRTRIEVPEWQETPCEGVLYAKPYTIDDDRQLARYLDANDPAGFVEVVVRKAELQSGEPAFCKADKPMLARTADAAVIKRIAMQIMASVSVEEAEGN
jgi:hypothetical protein